MSVSPEPSRREPSRRDPGRAAVDNHAVAGGTGLVDAKQRDEKDSAMAERSAALAPTPTTPANSSAAVSAEASAMARLMASLNVANVESGWAEAFRRGDEASWRLIVARYGPRLRGVIAGLLISRDQADDVLQDVMVAAWCNRRRFRGQAQLTTWLTSIAVNQCRARNRQAINRRRGWLGWLSQWTAEPSGSDRGSAAVIERESVDELRRAVDALPQLYREAIVLHYLEEMPSTDIAAALGIRDNTVRVRLTRARQLLKDSLSRDVQEH